MKKLGLLLVIIALALSSMYLFYNSKNANHNFSIESPLPSLLTRTFQKAYGSDNAWKPNNIVVTSNVPKPDTVSVSAGIYDLTENKFLYRKNPEDKLPIASLTKIMTAVVALENMDLSKNITIGDKAASIGEDSMGLSAGESLSLDDLLYGLVLNSGNDAAEAIASGSQFGRDNFVYLMNKKAEDLGLSNTHFTNPTGLQGDGQQYSTVDDLLVLTRYALQNPEFAKIAATYDYDIPQTDHNKEFHLYNETNLLTSYPGIKGVKTGFTDEAGYCLISYLEYDGHQVIGVLLNAQDRREEMKALLDYSLKAEGIKPPPHG